jgi:hypothetical protein
VEALIAVTVTLTCKLCGKLEARTLNLPPGVSPPREFTCSACTGEKSIADGMNDEELAAFKLPLPLEADIRRDRARGRIKARNALPQINPPMFLRSPDYI